MELSEIEAFVTISRSGGFTRAALLLHLSQPAISRRVELLERELGTPVFERLAGSIRLTGAGSHFCPMRNRSVQSCSSSSCFLHSFS